jgi:HD-like signal output (HDOD) protein
MQAVHDLFNIAGELPPLRDVAMRAIKEIEKPDCTIDDVVSIVARDGSLAGRIISLAGSVLFGSMEGCNSLPVAIQRVGLKDAKRCIQSIALMDAFPKLPKPYDPKDFWRMGLASAMIAQHLAQDLKFPAKDEVYLATLVHCLGEVYLLFHFTDDFEQAVKNATTPVELPAALLDEFECGHQDICAHLMEAWCFSEDVVEAVRHHLNPDDAGEQANMAHIVLVADRIARHLGMESIPMDGDTDWLGELPESSIQLLADAGLPPIEDYVKQLEEELGSIRALADNLI